MWNQYSFYGLLFASFLLSGSTEKLYLTTVPKGITLQNEDSSIQIKEISHVVNYLMGLPLESDVTWKGIFELDIFNRPRANLFINVFVPKGLDYTPSQYVAHYRVDSSNNMEIPSLESTEISLFDLFHGASPLIVHYEGDRDIFVSNALPDDLLNGLPTTLIEMRNRLKEKSSVYYTFASGLSLDVSNDIDAHFLGQVQLLSDILSKLSSNRKDAIDNTPDSFYFTLTSMRSLTGHYGINSNQVKSALSILNSFLPEFIASFNQLYNGMLLSEVNVVRSLDRSMQELSIRHKRSLSTPNKSTSNNSISNNSTSNHSAQIENMAEFIPSDYAVVVNLTFWIIVLYILSALVISHGIWFMDPGEDNIVYRMTNQRIKTE